MDPAPAGTAAVASSRPREHPEGPLQHETEHDEEGGLYNDFQVSDPIDGRGAARRWRSRGQPGALNIIPNLDRAGRRVSLLVFKVKLNTLDPT